MAYAVGRPRRAAAGPAPGLAAAATDAVQRIQRLLRPAEPLSRLRRLEHRHRLPQLGGPAFELAQGAEQLLGGAGRNLVGGRIGWLADLPRTARPLGRGESDQPGHTSP